MSSFVAHRPIRFAHCDPAGIAYYPRLFELCDSVIEDWTEQTLGISRRELHLERGLGLPTATIEAAFHVPARLGETLRIELSVVRVGNSSVDLLLSAEHEDEVRFTISYRQVLFTMEDGSSRAWPDSWREALRKAAATEDET